MRNCYDKLTDDCLAKLEVLRSNASQPTDLLALLRDNQAGDPLLAKLWQQVNDVPDWVSWPQVERGQNVFYRYGGANLTGLVFQSLLGGMGAARVVETLSRTGAFSTKTSRRRLFETAQHVLQVTKDIESIKPGGAGWESSVRVRLLHAAVRSRILKIERDKPGYYDVEAYGVPLNDLDNVATITTFSASLIWQALPRQGIFLTHDEAADYIALWRYVAYLLSCPTDPYFTDAANTKRVLESVTLYEIDPSPTGAILAGNLIAALSYSPPLYASPDMLLATARWLNGHELCDALGLPRPSWYYYALNVGQCLVFMTTGYGSRLSRRWDEHKQKVIRKRFWALIIDSNGGLDGQLATFEMKWIPRLGKMTVQQGPRPKARLAGNSIERRNRNAVILALLVVVVMSLLGLKGAQWAWHALFRIGALLETTRLKNLE
jgi:hypothetical protein